jgi:hypothetical protein
MLYELLCYGIPHLQHKVDTDFLKCNTYELKCEVLADGQILGELYTWTEVKINQQYEILLQEQLLFHWETTNWCDEVGQKTKHYGTK